MHIFASILSKMLVPALINSAIVVLEPEDSFQYWESRELSSTLISLSMGNIFTKRRTVVNEKYTQPQGLYEHIGLDTRKLRRLIINGQLAPCFPGVEDPSAELEECPICFLVFSFFSFQNFYVIFLFFVKCGNPGICSVLSKLKQIKMLYQSHMHR